VKIITHPGQAHNDEFLAVAVLCSRYNVSLIERRDPTQEELDDPDYIVVDVGGRHDPDKNNYDHHQFPRDHKPICALSLVLENMGIIDDFRNVFPWLSVIEELDSKGPFAVAKRLGIPPDDLLALQNPIASGALAVFADVSRIVALDGLHWLLKSIGDGIMATFENTQDRLSLLKAGDLTFQVGSVTCLDVRSIPADQQPTLALELFCKQYSPIPVHVTVTNDDRGPGFCLFRRNDDPRVDFSKINGHSDVIFAHANGFVAKTTPTADVSELIKLSLV